MLGAGVATLARQAPAGRAGGKESASRVEFDTLARSPQAFHTYSLRSQAEIDKYVHGRGLYKYAKVAYDQERDAAKWTWDATEEAGRNPNAEQIRVPIGLVRPETGSAKVLIISDHYWDDTWMEGKANWVEPKKGKRARLDGWKWLQVTDNVSGNQSIWAEQQTKFMGRDGYIARFGLRGYNSVKPPTVKGGPSLRVAGINYGSDNVGPMLHWFGARPNTWTRSYFEVEQRAGDGYAHISWWMADEKQDPVQILSDAQMVSGGTNATFYIEYNTSRPLRVGGEMHAWARNIVMLKNVNAADYLKRPAP